jgi:hypothetical protein
MARDLYHGTSIGCLLGIMAEDALRGDQADDLHDGASLTEAFAQGAKSAEQAETRDHDLEGRTTIAAHGWCAGAVVILDRARLSRVASLVPVR